MQITSLCKRGKVFRVFFGSFLFSISFLILSTNTYADTVDVIKGKQGFFSGFYTGKDVFGKPLENLTDGDVSTFISLYDRDHNPLGFDLGKNYTIYGYSLQAQPTGGGWEYLNIKYFDEKWNELKAYKKQTSANEKVLNVRYVTIGYVYGWAIKMHEFNVYGSDGKLGNISNLKANAETNKISFSWDNPQEDNFSGVKIYKDDKYLATVDKNTKSYVAKDLNPYTYFRFKFTSVDNTGKETHGITKGIDTLMPILDPPKSVYVTPQDKSLIIMWNDVKSPYLKGYNIYIDGQKVNTTLSSANKLVLKKLENGRAYKVQISSVNVNGVEGTKSKEVSEKPSKNAPTIEYDVILPFGVMEFLKTSLGFLAIVSPFVLLSLCFVFHKQILKFIKDSIKKRKERKEQS